MIKVIFGETGAGKTKRIIDIANETLKTANGSIVFIDNDSQYMFGLKHDIRFVDASEYHIDSPKMFFGFVSGILLPRMYVRKEAENSVSPAQSFAYLICLALLMNSEKEFCAC